MRNAMRVVLLLSLALVLALPVGAWAGGAPSDAGPAQVVAGPAQPTDSGGDSGASGANCDADQVRARDQLRDGTCVVDVEAPETEPLAVESQTRTQARARTSTQARVQTKAQSQAQVRTQAQDGSCEATAAGDGVPDRDQLRDRDQFKDGSCEVTGALAAAAYAEDSSLVQDRTRERETIVERVGAYVSEGVLAWVRTMLRVFGLAD